jgi:hypothetical protein
MRRFLFVVGWLGVTSSVTAAQGPSVIDCLDARDTESRVLCAQSSCERTVRAALPLPTTARVRAITSHGGGADQSRAEVEVEGKVAVSIRCKPLLDVHVPVPHQGERGSRAVHSVALASWFIAMLLALVMVWSRAWFAYSRPTRRCSGPSNSGFAAVVRPLSFVVRS